MEKRNLTIFITGASSGIGRETAIRLAKEGHKVFAGIRRKIDKEEIENLNENIQGVYIDVTNAASIEKAFWFVMKNAKSLDVLINNAGIAVGGPVELIDVKKLKEQFDVNTFGAVAVVQKFMPLLHNSRIINISSMAASGVFPFVAPYCASKRALDILFNSFALENKDNIKVISIKPSSVKTPIWNKSVKKAREYFTNISEEAKNKYEKQLLSIEKKALENNENAIETYFVVDKIIKVINCKNPKPSYNVGNQAVVAEWLSRLPLSISNRLIIKFLNSSK
ncbi:SDR family oxidoreductase [bacterium]|nr:SDR family oxidoreductase [bacterium]